MNCIMNPFSPLLNLIQNEYQNINLINNLDDNEKIDYTDNTDNTDNIDNIDNPNNTNYYNYNNHNKQNKSKDIRVILRLFPYLKNKELAKNLLIDDDSIHYISIREYAEKISNIILENLDKIEINKNDAVITDSMAGVGGDTISFAKHLKYVNAIEYDKNRSEYLKNNVKVYDLNNVNVINDDCLNVLNNIDNHDIIFFDPPWETKESGSYKKYKKLKLFVKNIPIEHICNLMMDSSYMKKIPGLIVLKLPKNYDISHFYSNVKKPIYYYDLDKMIILVIIVNKKT